MNTLKRILGVSGVVAIGFVLSQAHCDNGTPTPTPTPDLATPTPPPPDIAMNAAPTITAIAPASLANTGGMITITGTGFRMGATVTVGGVGCTGVNVAPSGTSITCTAPARATTCGKQSVVVTNTDLQAATNAQTLFYRSNTFGFATQVPITVPTGPNMVNLADYNKDQKLDILVSNRLATGSVTLLTGKGDGTFNAATTPAMTLANPIGLDTGDFNGDGNLDFVVAINGAAGNGLTFNIYTGKGDGTFNTALPTSVTGLTAVHGVRFADVNGDGSTDVLAVANGAGATSLVARINDKVANNNGFTGTQPALQNVGNSSTFVTSGDWNKDGNLDVAVSVPGSNFIAVRTGDKAGGFGGTTNLMSGNNNGQVVSADFNGDGNLDLAWASQAGNNVAVYTGSANGTFTAMTGSPFAVGTNPIGLAVADVNADGVLDIVAMNNGTASVSVLIGSAQGGFTGGAANTFTTATGGFSVAVGDLNGDGLPDVVTANSGTGSFIAGMNVSVLLQQCK